MSKLPIISAHECVKALQRAGFEVIRQRGSHIIMIRETPPAKVVVPNHREIAKGMLRTIIRDSGLTVDEFLDLL